MSTGEDAPQDQHQPEVAYMVEWLSQWKHPFEQNFKVLSTIAPDMETLGLHLQQWVEQRSRSEQIHTMEEMPVDGMFD